MKVYRAIGILSCVTIIGSVTIAMNKPAQAMPNFAQAYGIPCSYCHIQIPALNAYGRWVQRTGYAGLNPHVLEPSLRCGSTTL